VSRVIARFSRPPSLRSFPYTTLFRSVDPCVSSDPRKEGQGARLGLLRSRLRMVRKRDDFARSEFGGILRMDHDEFAIRLRFPEEDRKSTRLNSSHEWISYAVFCSTKKTVPTTRRTPSWSGVSAMLCPVVAVLTGCVAPPNRGSVTCGACVVASAQPRAMSEGG